MLIRSFYVRVVAQVLLLVGIGYAGLVLAAFIFQQDLLYHPDTKPFDPRLMGFKSFSEMTIQTPDALTLTNWYARARDPSKPTIVFFHGNAGGLATRAHKYGPWLNKGFGVLLIGYRGFGNPGVTTEKSMYADSAQSIDKMLATGVDPKKLVLYGESLGTGIAVQMALSYPVAGLVLESPYTSYPDAGATHYPYLPVHALARDIYDTASKIAQIKTPVLVLHGRADKTVPFTQGERVFALANEPKTAFFVDQAGHNDLYDYGAEQAVDKFLKSLGTQ